MSNYSVFDEDENDIFAGSPKSKFFDVFRNASSLIVQEEMDKIMEKLAICEHLLSKDRKINIDEDLERYRFENIEEIEELKKGLYLEYTGEIIQRLDS